MKLVLLYRRTYITPEFISLLLQTTITFVTTLSWLTCLPRLPKYGKSSVLKLSPARYHQRKGYRPQTSLAPLRKVKGKILASEPKLLSCTYNSLLVIRSFHSLLVSRMNSSFATNTLYR